MENIIFKRGIQAYRIIKVVEDCGKARFELDGKIPKHISREHGLNNHLIEKQTLQASSAA